MSLEVQAFSGVRAGVANTGWKATNAAFFIAALRAMYGEEFGWPEIEEFKRLNDIEDWEPREDLKADGLLLSGTVYTPDGFDLSGWGDYYADWKAGTLGVYLPDEVEDVPQFIPTNLGWNPTQPTIIETKPATSAANTAATTTATSAAVAASQPLAPPAPAKQKAQSDLPGWVWVAGGVAGLAVLSMVFGKKGRR